MCYENELWAVFEIKNKIKTKNTSSPDHGF